MMPNRAGSCDVVMQYGRSQTVVTAPQNVTDPIFPALSDLSTGQFTQFRDGLAQALGAAGFRLDLPFQDLRDCRTWTQVCIVVAAQL